VIILPAAYILVSTEIGAENRVLEKISEIEGVSEAYILFGVYDIIIKIKSDSDEELKGNILEEIRGTESVSSTITLIIADE
jgi:DNA-binding Lrp family transcriptional regulator